MQGTTNASTATSSGSETYEADLILLGVVQGLPQPDEDTVVALTVAVLQNI